MKPECFNWLNCDRRTCTWRCLPLGSSLAPSIRERQEKNALSTLLPMQLQIDARSTVKCAVKLISSRRLEACGDSFPVIRAFPAPSPPNQQVALMTTGNSSQPPMALLRALPCRAVRNSQTSDRVCRYSPSLPFLLSLFLFVLMRKAFALCTRLDATQTRPRMERLWVIEGCKRGRVFEAEF